MAYRPCLHFTKRWRGLYGWKSGKAVLFEISGEDSGTGREV